ncbi:hypothetical protein BDEG_27204 [Batrachochytrium dendrobatidis JEL423]|uniref:Peptidase A1 domain-containing protein n=1 Tax=Batrachochytrium dendrobatidis (strain JEL423) TaxID=403673 RepID=A0A177WWP3_BATDL|nr:hypothetical protein BDEG_27204 [Batrachochytrium dendrobatidis JEL423]
MLITLECVILALQAVAAVKIALESPIGTTSQSNNRLSKRSPVELGRDADQCFTMKFNVDGVDLDLRVDSAISSIIVPLPSSSSDVGLAPQHTPSGEPVTINYRGKQYRGVTSTAVVTIPGTRITDIKLPVLAVQKQSPDLVGIDPEFDGIFGFGYTSLSKHHPQITAMNTLYNDGVISNNEIGIQLCPYDILHESFINIGNTDVTAKCGTDGSSVAWVNSPTNDRHTVNIKNILINGEEVELPAEFQKKVENGRTLYSVIQTCSTFMYFPRVVVKALIDAILDSNAITVKKTVFSNKLNKKEVKRIFWEHYAMLESGFNIDWNKLPSFTIVMFAQNPVTDDNRNSVVKITLGPKDYIQRYDSEKFWFTVTAGSNDYAALGIPLMTHLAVTFDLQNKRTGFGPGCGCEVMADGYPTISNGYQVLWPLPHVRLPEQPTTSGSDGTFIRRRKPITTTDQVAVPENTHHTVKSYKQTLNKLD